MSSDEGFYRMIIVLSAWNIRSDSGIFGQVRVPDKDVT